MIISSDTKVFILKGAASTGKSTAIDLMVKFLLNNDTAVVLFHSDNKTRDEIINATAPDPSEHCAIIQCDKKNYLIMSKGDHEEELRVQFDQLNNFQNNSSIDVVIGASRTREGTVYWWDNFKSTYNLNNDIVFISKINYMPTSTSTQLYNFALFDTLRELIGLPKYQFTF